MCFTNSLNTKPKKLSEVYGVSENACPEFEPMPIANGFEYPEWPILTTTHPDQLLVAKWGLVPSWVHDDKKALQIRSSTLNARAETLWEKPAFKTAALHAQRCIVPTTGFFEWQTVGKKKYPHFISLKGAEVFSLAGLWEVQTREPGQPPVVTFTIITVDANPLLAKIHNTKKRMPAILSVENVSKWLDVKTPEAEIVALLTPFPENKMAAHSIRPFKQTEETGDFGVITQRFDYPELTQQLTLFSNQ